MIFAVAIDKEVAGHLAVAMKRHREAIERLGRRCPDGFVDLLDLATEIGGGREQTRTDEDRREQPADRPAYVGTDDELLTQREAAGLLGVHPKTVGRWITVGDLPHVQVGGRRRVPRRAIEQRRGGAD